MTDFSEGSKYPLTAKEMNSLDTVSVLSPDTALLYYCMESK